MNDPETARPEWERFEIYPPEGKRPVVIHHTTQDVLADSIEEIVETILDACLEKSHAALIQRIRESRQLTIFEFDPLQMTEDTWEMLDITEAFVAQSRDGVVFSSGEGIYDAALQPLCMFKHPVSE